MPPQRAPRPSARQPRACAVGEFPGSAARDPPRPLGPPPALAHPLAVRLSFPGGRDFRAEPGPQRAPPSRAAAWAGRAVGRSAAAGAQQPASPTAARPLAGPPPPGAMAGSSSLEAVRRKIRSLQEQADAAEERAGSLQRELDYERKLRETVRDPPITHHQRRLLPDRPPGAPQGLPEPTFSTPPPASGGTWRTWARRCRLGRGLAPSPRPFLSRWSTVKRTEGKAGVVLRRFWKQHFPRRGSVWGVCVRPGVSGPPRQRDVPFALLALFTQKVGTKEVPPFGNLSFWEGR